jgi:predicted DNA binding protein
MWRLRIRLTSEGQFLGMMAKKHKISMTGYPLSYWKDNKNLYLVSAGFVFGEEQNKKSLLRDIKTRPEYVESEQSGDFIITVTRQPLSAEAVYNPQIIRPNPVIINKDGYHLWDLASFDRKPLEKVISYVEKHLTARILSFRQEKISNITFTKLFPELTDNQKRAMSIAINAGYYDYPKKATLPELSKKMGISYSTFQAHLKKAEGKIFPLILKEL